MFFPESDALAYTDHMIGLGVFAAPITWLTGNVYLGHNVVFVLAVAFGAFAAFLAAFELTGSFPAALVGGAAFGFAPYWVSHEMHIQTLASGWIPLTLFGLLRWWRTGRTGWLCLTTASVMMASLTSWYQAAFVLVMVLVFVAWLLVAARPPRLARMALLGGLALVIAGAALWPFAAPYRRVADRDPTFTRNLRDVARYSAEPSSYLAAPPANLLFGSATERWSRSPGNVELNLFPGIAILALAGIGIAVRKRDTRERAGATALVILVLAGIVLSFGATPSGWRSNLPWAWLTDVTPLFRALRAAARAHVLVVLGLAMLAAVGARAVLGRYVRRSATVAVVLLGLIVLEGAAVPRRLGCGVDPPAAYAALASRTGGILELPAGRAYDVDHMLRGVGHWRPLANGVAGYTPASYVELLAALGGPPDASFVELVRERGISTVIVHLDQWPRGGPAFDAAFAVQRGVRVLHRAGRLVIYEVG